MKKIALFTDGWNRLITYAWNIGINEALKKWDEPVGVYQFNCFGNWFDDRDYMTGEYNIFNLTDMTGYDGILLDVTNITDDSVLSMLVDRAKESGLPVVSLGKYIEGLYYAGIDNEQTMIHLMEHLYYIHGCKRFVFAGGPKDNWDNYERENAYKNFVIGKGLLIDDNPIWNNKYTFQAGEQYFERWRKSRTPLPDVFVCGNDNIATGLITRAKKYGYEVPRDFLVTGFDNIEQSQYFTPHLTTVEQKRERISSAAMEILFDLWRGKPANKKVLIDNSCVFSQSCGCETEDRVDYPEYVAQSIVGTSKKNQLEDDLAYFQYKLTSANSFQRIFDITAQYILKQECDGFAVVLNQRLFDLEPFERFSSYGYDFDKLKLCLHTVNGKEIYDGPDTITSISDIATDECGGHFMFSPIHYQEKNLGFVMLHNGNILFDNPYFCNLLNYFTQALIRVYHSQALKYENNKLDHLYKHDQLTGAFNRIAFREIAEKYIFCLHEAGIPCALSFVDADYFKKINDTLGHDKGDEVLIKIAQTLQECCPNNGNVFRYGGDEFVVLFGLTQQTNIDDYVSHVTQNLMNDNISVSIGYICTLPGTPINLDELLREADLRMYEIKKERKSR